MERTKKKGFVKLDPSEKKRPFRLMLLSQNPQGREAEAKLRAKAGGMDELMDLDAFAEGLAWMAARKAYQTGQMPDICEGTIRNLCGKGNRPKSIGSERTLRRLAEFVGVDFPKRRV